MASKVISLTEEVYDLLKSRQLPNESFGDTIKRLCLNYSAKNMSTWAQLDNEIKLVPEEVWDEFETDVKEVRKRSIIDQERNL